MNDSARASTSNSVDEQSSGNNQDEFHNSTKAPTDNEDRPSCKFGRQCFRHNPKHRLDMAHPGDVDYEVPEMPSPIEGAPKCEYGRKCYRLNPEHFKNFEHPRNINMQENYRKLYLRGNANRTNSGSDADDTSDEEEDIFAVDSDDADYVPSEND